MQIISHLRLSCIEFSRTAIKIERLPVKNQWCLVKQLNCSTCKFKLQLMSLSIGLSRDVAPEGDGTLWCVLTSTITFNEISARSTRAEDWTYFSYFHFMGMKKMRAYLELVSMMHMWKLYFEKEFTLCFLIQWSVYQRDEPIAECACAEYIPSKSKWLNL